MSLSLFPARCTIGALWTLCRTRPNFADLLEENKGIIRS